MSSCQIPGLMCDHDDGCDAYAEDLTLGGLATIVGSTTQLPDGWSGTRPGDRPEHHLCPRHTRRAAEEAAELLAWCTPCDEPHPTCLSRPQGSPT